jgi:hypothetical protein
MANTMDAGVRKKADKADRMFIASDGGLHPRSFPGVRGVRIRFTETEAELDMMLEELSQDMLLAAAAFGLNTSVGNTFGAIADPIEALEAAESRWETLRSGVWSSERHVGPRTTDLVEAVVRWYVSNGREISDDDRAKIVATVGDAAAAKALQADPEVGVHLAAIRKERAEAKQREAQDRLKGAAGKPSAAAGILG